MISLAGMETQSQIQVSFIQNKQKGAATFVCFPVQRPSITVQADPRSRLVPVIGSAPKLACGKQPTLLPSLCLQSKLAPSSVWILRAPVAHDPRPQLASKILCMYTVSTQYSICTHNWPCPIPMPSGVTIHEYACACSQAWPSCMFHYLTSAAEDVTSLAWLSTAGSPTVFAPKDRVVAYAMNTAFPGCETPSPTPNVKQKCAFVFSSQFLQQTEACFLMTQPTWGKVLFTKATR